CLVQLRYRDLEHLVTRVILDDLDEILAAGTARSESGKFEHGRGLASEQGDSPHTLRVGHGGEQPEEPAFADYDAGFVERLDTDVIQVDPTMDGRPRVGLRNQQELRIAHPGAHFLR